MPYQYAPGLSFTPPSAFGQIASGLGEVATAYMKGQEAKAKHEKDKLDQYIALRKAGYPADEAYDRTLKGLGFKKPKAGLGKSLEEQETEASIGLKKAQTDYYKGRAGGDVSKFRNTELLRRADQLKKHLEIEPENTDYQEEMAALNAEIRRREGLGGATAGDPLKSPNSSTSVMEDALSFMNDVRSGGAPARSGVFKQGPTRDEALAELQKRGRKYR